MFNKCKTISLMKTYSEIEQLTLEEALVNDTMVNGEGELDKGGCIGTVSHSVPDIILPDGSVIKDIELDIPYEDIKYHPLLTIAQKTIDLSNEKNLTDETVGVLISAYEKAMLPLSRTIPVEKDIDINLNTFDFSTHSYFTITAVRTGEYIIKRKFGAVSDCINLTKSDNNGYQSLLINSMLETISDEYGVPAESSNYDIIDKLCTIFVGLLVRDDLYYRYDTLEHQKIVDKYKLPRRFVGEPMHIYNERVSELHALPLGTIVLYSGYEFVDYTLVTK